MRKIEEQVARILQGAFMAALSMPDFYKDPEKFQQLCEGVAKTIIYEARK